MNNIDANELQKFARLAQRWWDKNGAFKSLHDINPLRLSWINSCVDLAGKRVLDVGCGGGILAESMAQLGAEVIGIDLGEQVLNAARSHQAFSQVPVKYRLISVEDLAQELPASFDVVTCMEMLEHVPYPATTIKACAKLVAAGGHVFFSTINRTPKAYWFAIVGAEYVLKLLPQGTHNYDYFIRPSELVAWLRDANLELAELRGMSYSPFTKSYTFSQDVSINYLVHAML